MGRKLFCEYGPVCYKISLYKKYLLRDMRQLLSGSHYAAQIHADAPLPHLVKGHISPLMRQLHGVEMRLQENKVQNLRLASAKINGILIQPGETFSF